MRIASLFSGIGGFELGFGARASLSLQNDSDPAARAVLANRFSRVPLIDDVADVLPLNLDHADMLVAGFPCQDVSIVGGQRGLAGTKTPLVRHVFRLAERAKPDRLLLENVQSIRFVHGGRVLAYLMDEAERLGYAWAYRTLDSRAFGLAQRRRRVYFLASKVDDPGTVLLADAGASISPVKPNGERPIGFYWTEGRAGHGLTDNAIPPLKSGSAVGIPSPPAVLMPDGTVKVPTIASAELLQGFPSGWTEAAPTRARWRLVGNAVSPPVIKWIADHLDTPNPWNSTRSRLMSNGSGWPLSAWGDGKGARMMVEAGEAPDTARIGYLSELQLDWEPISERALAGFMSRARSSTLRYPEGFLDRLERALDW